MRKLKLLLTEVNSCTYSRCGGAPTETYTCHEHKGNPTSPFKMRKWVTTNNKREATHITLDQEMVVLVDEVEISKEQYIQNREYLARSDEATIH